MNNIMVMRFVNGDHIIAQTENISSTNLKLVNPAMIMMMTDPGTQQSKVAMGDYLIFSEKKEIIVDLAHIMFMHEPTFALTQNYNRMFGGSSIEIPDPKILPFNIPGIR